MYENVPLQDAAVVLLKDAFGQIFEEEVLKGSPRKKSFVNKKITYVWDPEVRNFVKLRGVDESMRQSEFHKQKEGLGQMTVADRFQEYGDNEIKISVPSVAWLLVHEALNPFYLFQAYTVILWSIQFYWKFAVVIAITSVISVTFAIWESRRQNRNLRDKMKSESSVECLRNGSPVFLSSLELVPGDVILLPTRGGFTMECDAVLVEGSVVVNESMLTGESIPITKIVVPDEDEDFKYDLKRQHVVFCGTEVLQGKNSSGAYCKAVVIRTGFMTTKGELVRAILFPPPLDFRFHRDFLRSLYVFLTLGLIGMAYSMYVWIGNGGTINEILLNSLDILTFVVPPILPAALTSNNAFAQKRLERLGIYCLHSKHIPLCGGIDICAFDKTGTLTSDELDLAGVVESKKSVFCESTPDPSTLPLDSPLVQAMATCHSLIRLKGKLTGNPLDVKLFEAIGWELTENTSGGINPDYGIDTPTLVSPPKHSRSSQRGPRSSANAPSNLEIAVLKTYPFDSAVQRMTVITKKKGSPVFNVYVKGAPEKVASLCRPETIPADFATNLQLYTKQGLRVIAAAYKSLNANTKFKDADDMPRLELEQKCEFLGLIIMQNSVKEETYGAIKELHDADINTVMVTGDNILTAISVGRDCGLIKPDQTVIRVEAELGGGQYMPNLNVSYTLEEKSNIVRDHVASVAATVGGGVTGLGSGGTRADKEIVPPEYIRSVQERNYVFACDGKTFGMIRNHDKALLERLVQRGKIFARMLPEQKIHLIETMKDLGRQVVMCGDGCNDCGALKTAHAGISLSMAEASVAAPFTSRNVHIGCVPEVIKEGRATMVSAFASFKFGVSFCFTQLIAVLIVFWIGTEPSDNQYLVVDIGLGAVPIMMIGNCGPHHTLVKQKPSRNLLSFIPIFSILTFLLWQTLTYIFVWFFVQTQEWFVPYEFVAGLWPPNPSYEQTQIFILSCNACVIASIVFSKGAPYRKHLFTNGIMAAWLIAGIATTVFICLFDSEDFRSRLNMKIPESMNYKLTLLAIMVVSGVFCWIWEVLVLDGICFFKLLPLYKQYFRGPSLPFEHLEEELKSKAGWPPIGDCKNNEIKIAVTLNSSTTNKPGSYGGTTSTMVTAADRNTHGGESSSIALRDHLKMASKDVKQSIKNRWSGDGTSLGAGGSGSGAMDEEQGLLHGAQEPPFDSPLPYRAAHSAPQQANINSPSTSSTNNYYPDSSQLHSMLGDNPAAPPTTATTAISPINQKKETTIC